MFLGILPLDDTDGVICDLHRYAFGDCIGIKANQGDGSNVVGEQDRSGFRAGSREARTSNFAEREAIERDRGLSTNLFRMLCDAGFFALWLPRSLGSPELTPADLARVVEVLSRADGSVGWLAGIASSNSRLGYLPEEVARRIWSDGNTVLAGTLNPVGTAVAIPGG